MNLIGHVLGSRYQLEERLGTGSMGTVYRARHLKIGRLFAVKVLHRELLAHRDLVERFEQEALVAGRLEHPNVVRVVDFGEMDDGTRYTVMDLVPGTPLSAMMGLPMAPNRVVTLVSQLLDGLQHAHEVGLIHRDFKPDNVIVERGEDGSETPRIVDFGIAILHQHASSYEARGRLTTMGVVLGTPEYMAPEQARGEVMDHRADLFALGITCYELLTGKLPFDGSGVEIAIENMTNATPAMGIRVPCVDVDPLLEAFTHKLARKNPNDRPASASAARALLQMIATDRVAAAIELGLTPRPRLHADLDPQRTIPLAVHADVPAVLRLPVIAVTEYAEVAPPARRRPFRVRSIARACTTLLALSALAFAARSARVPTHEPPPPDVIDLQFPPSGSSSSSQRAVGFSPAPSMRHRVLPASSFRPITTAAKRDRRVPPQVAVAAVVPVAVVEVVSPPSPVAPQPLPGAVAVDSSAAAVAGLYRQLGMELVALGQTQGREATNDLWVRYRHLRFQDTIATATSRARDSQILLAIQRETTRRAER